MISSFANRADLKQIFYIPPRGYIGAGVSMWLVLVTTPASWPEITSSWRALPCSFSPKQSSGTLGVGCPLHILL